MASRYFAFASLVFALALAACGGSDVPDSPDAALGPDAMTECPDPPPAVCDYFLSCGCGIGEKCTRGSTGPECVLVTGTKQPGDTCGNEGECAAGSTCFEYPTGSGESHCLAFCDDAHMCADGTACYISVIDLTGTEIGTVCGQSCSLIGQDCANATLGCYNSSLNPTPEEGICATAGTAQPGDTCAQGNDCAEGSTCIGDSGGGGSHCRKYCDTTAADPGCGSGEVCNPVAGSTTTGVCVP